MWCIVIPVSSWVGVVGLLLRMTHPYSHWSNCWLPYSSIQLQEQASSYTTWQEETWIFYQTWINYLIIFIYRSISYVGIISVKDMSYSNLGRMYLCCVNINIINIDINSTGVYVQLNSFVLNISSFANYVEVRNIQLIFIIFVGACSSVHLCFFLNTTYFCFVVLFYLFMYLFCFHSVFFVFIWCVNFRGNNFFNLLFLLFWLCVERNTDQWQKRV